MRLMCCAIAAACLASVPSFAADSQSRFCLGSDMTEHVAYLTQVFDSQLDKAVLEDGFSHFLTTQKLDFTNVQCPAPTDRPTAFERLQNAKDFLEGLGFKIVPVQ